MPTPQHSSKDKPDTGDDTTAKDDKSKSDDAPFYCPGCGRRYTYQQQCTGKPESPHPPIEVVSTDELRGGGDVTPAPPTDNLG